MRIRNAFTMIELIFVIVVMGIIGKFGTEFLAQSYDSFIFSKINNTLQSNSAISVEFIASRLQHRIKDSAVVREGNTSDFTSLASAAAADAQKFTVLEWVSTDVDNFRGTREPNWTGIIDINHPSSSTTVLVSPDTNTSKINATVNTLSYGDSGIDDAALIFIGANTDINGYGWGGVALTDQENVMHPINDITTDLTQFAPAVGSFSGIDIYEYYKLAWTANAVVMENYDTEKYNGKDMGDLYFYYDYQPWNGQNFYTHGKRALLMEQVSTFQAMAIGSIIKIQICSKSDLVEEYALCKEKTIF